MGDEPMDMGVQQAEAGDWVIHRGWRLSYRRITKATPKQFKLGEGSVSYPTLVSKSDQQIVAVVRCDRETVDQLCNSIAGVDGEFNRMCAAADAERKERVGKAKAARERAIERLLQRASGTPQSHFPTAPTPVQSPDTTTGDGDG